MTDKFIYIHVTHLLDRDTIKEEKKSNMLKANILQHIYIYFLKSKKQCPEYRRKKKKNLFGSNNIANKNKVEKFSSICHII